jgi:hypothetical protein
MSLLTIIAKSNIYTSVNVLQMLVGHLMTRFWTRICALAVVGILVFGGLVVISATEKAQAARGRQELDYLDAYFYYSPSIPGSALALGDMGVKMIVEVENIRTDSPPRINNITVHVGSVEPTDPFNWKTRDCIEKWNLTGRYYSDDWTGLEFDVLADAATGIYNVTIGYSYDYQVPGLTYLHHDEETDVVQIQIYSLFTVDKKIAHFTDTTSLPPGTDPQLYAGESFQKMGFNAPRSSMFSYRTLNGNKVSATIVDKSGVDYSGLTWKERAATIQDVTASSYNYFFYRLSVDSSKNAGRYDYTLELKYTRKDRMTNNQPVVITENTVVSLVVDFTPVLDISSGGEPTIVQGVTTQTSFSVMMRNNGNCDLAKLKIWLDISNYYQYRGGSYFDGDGYISYAGTETAVESLLKGTAVLVDFKVDIYKYIPPGEHRLPIRYSGYYYDDGSFSYSDWKYTTDSTYYSINGKELYLKVTVTDRDMAITAVSTSSFNLGGNTKALRVPVELTNHEELQYDDVALKLGTFPRSSPMNPVFVNPGSPGSNSLQTVNLLSLPSASTETVAFMADLAPGVRPGGYDLELNLTATDHNTRLEVSKTLVVSFQVYPMPPKFAILGSYVISQVRAGKDFMLTVSLENTGLDRAREVFVSVGPPNNGLQLNAVLDLHDMDPSSLEHTINPFTVTSSRVFLGDIAAGTTNSENFTVHVDYNVVKGRSYAMAVDVSYRDSFGGVWNQSNMISLTAAGTPSAKAAPANPWDQAMTPLLMIMIVLWVLIIIGAIIIKKTGGPGAMRRHGETPAPAAAPPAPPAGQAFAPAQQQYFPPPPVSSGPPQPQQAQTMEGPRPCRKCGIPVPAGNYICPNCGNPM